MEELNKKMAELNQKIGARLAEIDRNIKDYGEKDAEILNNILRQMNERDQKNIETLQAAEEIILGIR